jgi:hypothetical protein
LIASLRACQQTRARLDRRRIEVEERAIALDGSRRGSTPGLPETHETRRRAETDLTEPSAPAMDNVPTLVGNDGTLPGHDGRSVDLIERPGAGKGAAVLVAERLGRRGTIPVALRGACVV